ncbi:hypothetical protein KAU15_06620 [candidate division WOR-3 bacterium]|nr:hypothetical protein [candidate division WOR-3 bacterium]
MSQVIKKRKNIENKALSFLQKSFNRIIIKQVKYGDYIFDGIVKENNINNFIEIKYIINFIQFKRIINRLITRISFLNFPPTSHIKFLLVIVLNQKIEETEINRINSEMIKFSSNSELSWSYLILKESELLQQSTGEKPGKGTYKCTRCGQEVILDDTTDTLPPCLKCNNT